MFDIRTPLHHAYLVRGSHENTLVSLETFLQDALSMTFAGHPNVVKEVYDRFSVDDARSLRERHSLKAVSAHAHEPKLFLIAINFMTREAQNALLKAFEEPVPNTHFFIVSPSLHFFLPTLMSRVQVVAQEGEQATGSMEKAAKAFLKAGYAERLETVADLVALIKDEKESKMKAIELCDTLTAILHERFQAKNEPEVAAGLETLIAMRDYLFDQSASYKTILEYVSLRLPVLSI